MTENDKFMNQRMMSASVNIAIDAKLIRFDR